MAALPVVSREYKVMLEHRAFEGRDAAASFWEEAADFARSVGISAQGEFDEIEKRTIVFLDSADFTLKSNGYVLRERKEKGDDETKYTLKCRNEDRYVAAAADVRAASGQTKKQKLEEDIAAPFRSRFSHSNTIKVSGEESTPRMIEDAASMFLALSKVQRNGMLCPPETPLRPVNNVRAFERVLTGPTMQLADEEAEVALILWSNGSKGRPLVAEFSFRYADENENYSADVARMAMEFFLLVQRLDWCRPHGMTKTEYVYRTHARE